MGGINGGRWGGGDNSPFRTYFSLYTSQKVGSRWEMTKVPGFHFKNFSHWITKFETEGLLKVDGEVMKLITRRQSEE